MLTPDRIDALREGVRKITDPITEYLLRDISHRIAQAAQLLLDLPGRHARVRGPGPGLHHLLALRGIAHGGPEPV